MGAAPCEKESSAKCGRRRPGSACTSAQSDQGHRCLLTESFKTIECSNGEQLPGWDFAHAQDDLNLLILRMQQGPISLDAAQMELVPESFIGLIVQAIVFYIMKIEKNMSAL